MRTRYGGREASVTAVTVSAVSPGWAICPWNCAVSGVRVFLLNSSGTTFTESAPVSKAENSSAKGRSSHLDSLESLTKQPLPLLDALLKLGLRFLRPFDFCNSYKMRSLARFDEDQKVSRSVRSLFLNSGSLTPSRLKALILKTSTNQHEPIIFTFFKRASARLLSYSRHMHLPVRFFVWEFGIKFDQVRGFHEVKNLGTGNYERLFSCF